MKNQLQRKLESIYLKYLTYNFLLANQLFMRIVPTLVIFSTTKQQTIDQFKILKYNHRIIKQIIIGSACQNSKDMCKYM